MTSLPDGSATGSDLGGAEAGAVYVLLGPVAGDAGADQSAAVLHGVAAGDQAGLAVAMGDVDGDGWGDLVIGAPLEPDGGEAGGVACVVLAAP